MAGRGRPKAELVLTTDERAMSLRWSRMAKSSQALALRCRIVPACAEGVSNAEVAEAVGDQPTAGGQVAVAVRAVPVGWSGGPGAVGPAALDHA